jgi:hypothetical protein
VVAFDGSPMSSSPRTLSSWKEIAHHLGVNVRTAQKWERDRSLPVTRVQGARSRVSADPAKLDVWKQQLACGVTRDDRCYCWPLGDDVKVEVRFLGASLAPAHLDLLRAYLELVKTAVSSKPAR